MIRLPQILRSAEDGAGSAAAVPPAASPPAAAPPAAAPPSLVTPPAPAAAPPEPWYRAHKFDEPTERFLEDRKFPDMQTALRSGIEADRLARSRNVIEKPESDPDKLKNWAGWSELGWKPNEQDYKFKRPQTPDGFTYEQPFEDAFRTAAHENRVPLHAAQAILDAVTKYAVGHTEAQIARGARLNQELGEQLRANWGPDYDRNVELARRAARHVGVGAAQNAELEAIMGSPALVAIFHKIGGMIGEDALVTLGGGPLPESVEAMEADLRRKRADPVWRKSLEDPRSPNHQDIKAEDYALREKIAKAKLARGK